MGCCCSCESARERRRKQKDTIQRLQNECAQLAIDATKQQIAQTGDVSVFSLQPEIVEQMLEECMEPQEPAMVYKLCTCRNTYSISGPSVHYCQRCNEPMCTACAPSASTCRTCATALRRQIDSVGQLESMAGHFRLDFSHTHTPPPQTEQTPLVVNLVQVAPATQCHSCRRAFDWLHWRYACRYCRTTVCRACLYHNGERCRACAELTSADGGSEGQCVVCMEKQPNIVCLPCGHLCMCRPCLLRHRRTRAGQKCPICRVNVTTFQTIFTN